MDAPPRLDPGAIACDGRQPGVARLLERLEHRRSGNIPGRINRRTVPHHYVETRPGKSRFPNLGPRGAVSRGAALWIGRFGPLRLAKRLGLVYPLPACASAMLP